MFFQFNFPAENVEGDYEIIDEFAPDLIQLMVQIDIISGAPRNDRRRVVTERGESLCCKCEERSIAE
jgi:hypothetical protein